MTVKEYAARMGITYRKAVDGAARIPGAVKTRDAMGRLVWEIPEDAIPQGSGAASSPLPGAPGSPFPSGGASNSSTDHDGLPGDMQPVSPADPWADLLDTPIRSVDSNGSTGNGEPSPDAAAGLSALILTGLEAFPALEIKGTRRDVAKLWSDTAGDLLSRSAGMNAEGVKYAVLAIGAIVLFAPLVLRRKSPPGGNMRSKREREDGLTPGNSVEDSATNWHVP
jgi:hypothetical protein